MDDLNFIVFQSLEFYFVGPLAHSPCDILLFSMAASVVALADIFVNGNTLYSSAHPPVILFSEGRTKQKGLWLV